MQPTSKIGYSDVVISFLIFAVGIATLPPFATLDIHSFLSGLCFGVGGIAGSRAIHTFVKRRPQAMQAQSAQGKGPLG